MNVLVTGALGQLGRELMKATASCADNYHFTDIVSAPEVDCLDATDFVALKQYVDTKNIDVIVNCAAYTNVESAQDNPEMAFKLNAEMPELLASVMAERGGLLIHISTDYVFGGIKSNTPLNEDAPCCPVNVYGESKLAGEEAVRKSGCNYLIFRTAWLYSAFGNNFLLKMLKLTEERKSLSVVCDQAGTPTCARGLARLIHGIISEHSWTGKCGTYNYTDEGVCSWYDFTVAIAAFSGHDKCRINPCLSLSFPTKAVRPAYSVLDKSSVKETFGVSIRHWAVELKEYMQVERLA